MRARGREDATRINRFSRIVLIRIVTSLSRRRALHVEHEITARIYTTQPLQKTIRTVRLSVCTSINAARPGPTVIYCIAHDTAEILAVVVCVHLFGVSTRVPCIIITIIIWFAFVFWPIAAHRHTTHFVFFKKILAFSYYMILYGRRARTTHSGEGEGLVDKYCTTAEDPYTWRIVGRYHHFRYDSGVGHRDHAEGRNITGGYPLYRRVSTTRKSLTRIFFPPLELFLSRVWGVTGKIYKSNSFLFPLRFGLSRLGCIRLLQDVLLNRYNLSHVGSTRSSITIYCENILNSDEERPNEFSDYLCDRYIAMKHLNLIWKS